MHGLGRRSEERLYRQEEKGAEGEVAPVAAIAGGGGGTEPNNLSQPADSEWQASGYMLTYVSATSFTVVGDQSSLFHAGRRLKCTVTRRHGVWHGGLIEL